MGQDFSKCKRLMKHLLQVIAEDGSKGDSTWFFSPPGFWNVDFTFCKKLHTEMLLFFFLFFFLLHLLFICLSWKIKTWNWRRVCFILSMTVSCKIRCTIKLFPHALFPTLTVCLFPYLALPTQMYNLLNMQNLLLQTYPVIFAIILNFVVIHITHPRLT